MIKTLMIFFFSFLFNHGIQAFQFRANAQVFLNRTYGEVRVVNNLPTPIICNGSAVGLTTTGRQVFSYMNQVRIFPGQFAYLNVYTNNYEPFVQVVPRIFCQQSF